MSSNRNIGDGIDCSGVIISGSGNIIIGDTAYKLPIQECAKQSALNRSPLLVLSPMRATEPVLAKSCLRGAGCTDAGTEEEPQSNVDPTHVMWTQP